MDVIPVAGIMDAYVACSPEKKAAISNVVMAGGYLTSTVIYKGETPDISVDWKADPATSITLVMSMIHIGNQQFGDVWLKALKNSLSLQA